MKAINPYLNFDGKAEEAFNFYKSVFGVEFITVMRFNEMPPSPGAPAIPDNEKNRLLRISLPFGNGNILMGSDIMPSMGHKLTVGNNFYIPLTPTARKRPTNYLTGYRQAAASKCR